MTVHLHRVVLGNMTDATEEPPYKSKKDPISKPSSEKQYSVKTTSKSVMSKSMLQATSLSGSHKRIAKPSQQTTSAPRHGTVVTSVLALGQQEGRS